MEILAKATATLQVIPDFLNEDSASVISVYA